MRSSRLPGIECVACPRCYGSTYEPEPVTSPGGDLCQECWGIGVVPNDPGFPWERAYNIAWRACAGPRTLPPYEQVRREMRARKLHAAVNSGGSYAQIPATMSREVTWDPPPAPFTLTFTLHKTRNKRRPRTAAVIEYHRARGYARGSGKGQA